MPLTNSNIRFDRDDGAVVKIELFPGEGLGGAPVLGYLKDGKGSAPEFGCYELRGVVSRKSIL